MHIILSFILLWVNIQVASSFMEVLKTEIARHFQSIHALRYVSFSTMESIHTHLDLFCQDSNFWKASILMKFICAQGLLSAMWLPWNRYFPLLNWTKRYPIEAIWKDQQDTLFAGLSFNKLVGWKNRVFSFLTLYISIVLEF